MQLRRNMNKKLLFLLIFVALAVIVRLLPPWSIDIGWRINERTHRGIPLNHVVFWVLLTVSAILGAVELGRRFTWRAP
jgi:hypothetical protein